MIVVSFLPQQGIGNQLWLLFAALSLSKNFDLQFRIHNPQYFKAWNLLSNSFKSTLLSVDPLDNLENYTFLQPSLFKYKSGNLYFPLRLESFSFLTFHHRVILQDICQSIHLLEDPTLTASYFNKSHNPIPDPDNTCIINIRGGDYLGFRKSPLVPRQYYFYAIEKMKSLNPDMKFFIVTDDYRFAQSFMPGFPIIKGDFMSDFNVLRNAHYLILSNSSFAFFPTFISSSLQLAFAPAYWAPSTKPERRSLSWFSPANFYATLFRYLNPYDGTEINSSISEFDACRSTFSVTTPLTFSLFSSYEFKAHSTNNVVLSKSGLLKSTLKSAKKYFLYSYLHLRNKF